MHGSSWQPLASLWWSGIGLLACSTVAGLDEIEFRDPTGSGGALGGQSSGGAAAEAGAGGIDTGGTGGNAVAGGPAGGSGGGEHLAWARRFGLQGNQIPSCVKLDSNDEVVVAASFTGAIDTDGWSLASAGLEDIVLFKLDTTGNHRWSQYYGSSLDDLPNGCAVDAERNVYLTGHFSATVDFGGGALTASGARDVFLLKLDADGHHSWSQRFGAGSSDVGTVVAIDTAGQVVLGGVFKSTVSFGGQSLTSAGENDVFLAKLDSEGQHQWSVRFGGAGYDFVGSLAIDGSDNLYVAGWFNDAIDFGEGEVVGAGGVDAYVAKFDPAGSLQWARTFGADGDEYMGLSVVADGAGSVYISGELPVPLDLGGGLLAVDGGLDVVAAKLSADGEHLWSRTFPGADQQSVQQLTLDASGQLLLAGWLHGSLELGDATMTSAGADDAFVVALGTTGLPLSSWQFGDGAGDRAFRIDASASGGWLVAGAFEGSIDFGVDLLTSYAETDLFVARAVP